MRIKKTEKDNILIIGILGRMDAEFSFRMRNQIYSWAQSNPNIILDCRELEYIDSNGLGTLLLCLRTAVALGGDFRIAAPLPAVSMVFEFTRTQRVFRIFKTLAQARESFHEIPNFAGSSMESLALPN